MAINIGNVFAQNGDTTVVPEGVQLDGSINFDEGYGGDYQRNPATDPEAKRIERAKMNYLFNVLFGNAKEVLQYGFNNHIVGKEYNENEIVRATNGFIYRSKINTNVDAPPTANWEIYFLPTNNTITFTPTANYHPVTKKYVDDEISGISLVGALSTDNFLHIQDQKPSGTQGGSSISGEQTRVLNTVLTNTISGASLLSNQITLPAGTTFITSNVGAYGTNNHRAKIRNVTDSTYIIMGSSEIAGAGDTTSSRSFISGQITLASAKVLEIRHGTSTATASTGLGQAKTDGDAEVYTDIQIWKVG